MPGAWTDRQGIVRFSLTQGSVTLESMSFHVETGIDMSSHNVYDLTVVPVPEPSVATLFVVSLIASGVWLVRKKVKGLTNRCSQRGGAPLVPLRGSRSLAQHG